MSTSGVVCMFLMNLRMCNADCLVFHEKSLCDWTRLCENASCFLHFASENEIGGRNRSMERPCEQRLREGKADKQEKKSES